MKVAGFSLVELVVVIAIVAILAAIAIPSYRSYVTSSYLTDAFNTLSSYKVQMEQYYQDNANYGTANCGVAMPATKYFNYACALSNGGQGFTITATANGTSGFTGYTFTVNDAGTQTTTAFPGATVPAACWLSKSSGC